MRRGEHIYSIDYYAYQSPMRSWNSGFKVLLALVILFLCLAENSITVSFYITVTMAAVNIAKNRISPADYLKLMSIPLVFIFLGGAAIALDVGTGTGGWYIRITGESAAAGLNVILRAFGAVSALYMLTLSTPVNEITAVLRCAHMPVVITELMNLIYRYIFILMDTQCRIKDSAVSRLGYQDFATSCSTFGKSMGSLLVQSLRKSGLYYDAMEARGYDGELRFLKEDKPLKMHLVIGAALYFVSIHAVKMLADARWMI